MSQNSCRDLRGNGRGVNAQSKPTGTADRKMLPNTGRFRATECTNKPTATPDTQSSAHQAQRCFTSSVVGHAVWKLAAGFSLADQTEREFRSSHPSLHASLGSKSIYEHPFTLFTATLNMEAARTSELMATLSYMNIHTLTLLLRPLRRTQHVLLSPCSTVIHEHSHIHSIEV